MYDEGISKTGALLDLGVEHEIIDKRGAFYSYGDTRLGQGRENSKRFLKDDVVIADEIEKAIRDISAPDKSETVKTREDDEVME